MKKILIVLLLALAAMSVNAQRYVENRDTVYTVHAINQVQFADLIADWQANEWALVSPRPVVVDFYADWCGPCRRLAPILRDIAQHYHGEVDFYRINVDENPDIAAAFEVRSIPMLLIWPLDGDPKTLVGLYSMQDYIRIINQVLAH